MNIKTPIQAALTALNSSAELFALERSRAENEELQHSENDIIVIYMDWKVGDELNTGFEITENREYEIVFKTYDEWDNSDADNQKSYNLLSTMSIIERMQTLANSVFRWISISPDFPEIKGKLKWKTTPLVRKGGGTMSGVTAKMTIVNTGSVQCDFSN